MHEREHRHAGGNGGLDRRDFLKRSAAVGAAAMGLSVVGLGDTPSLAGGNAKWWGALAQPRAGQDAWDAVRALERQVGRRFGTIHHRFPWTNDLVNHFTRWGVETGHKPILGWNGNMRGGGSPIWGAIAAGNHDAWITAQARSLRGAGWSAFLTFHKEPEREGNPADFRAAYDRIRRIFDNVGVTRVKWIVTLTAATYNSGTAAQWLPNRFDFLGVDGYNRGGCTGNWKGFGDTFRAARTFARARGRGLYLVEVGCTEGGARRKAAWIDDARATIKQWPEVVGFSYNHERTDCAYYVDSSRSALNAFSRMGNDPKYAKGRR